MFGLVVVDLITSRIISLGMMEFIQSVHVLTHSHWLEQVLALLTTYYHKYMAGQQEAVLFLGNIFVDGRPVCGIFDNGIYRFDLAGISDGSPYVDYHIYRNDRESILFIGQIHVNGVPVSGIFDNAVYSATLAAAGDCSPQFMCLYTVFLHGTLWCFLFCIQCMRTSVRGNIYCIYSIHIKNTNSSRRIFSNGGYRRASKNRIGIFTVNMINREIKGLS